MPKFYVVNGVGGGFDGLVVEGEVFDDYPHIVQISKIIDTNVNVGDRTLALPTPPRSLFIGKDCLTETDDPGLRQFASDNPFGSLLREGVMTCGTLKAAYAEFENVMQVSLTETNNDFGDKTIFSQYFFNDFAIVMQAVEDNMKQKGDSDADDLVFKLRALKEAETNGQA